MRHYFSRSLFLFFILLSSSVRSDEFCSLEIAVIHQRPSRDTISITDIPFENDVIAGAMMGSLDNNTTGKFTKQQFNVVDYPIDDENELKHISGSPS